MDVSQLGLHFTGTVVVGDKNTTSRAGKPWKHVELRTLLGNFLVSLDDADYDRFPNAGAVTVSGDIRGDSKGARLILRSFAPEPKPTPPPH
jgi:hypothetical protein